MANQFMPEKEVLKLKQEYHRPFPEPTSARCGGGSAAANGRAAGGTR